MFDFIKNAENDYIGRAMRKSPFMMTTADRPGFESKGISTSNPLSYT